jgi:tetratricopeptide (TPR) repeat protein
MYFTHRGRPDDAKRLHRGGIAHLPGEDQVAAKAILSVTPKPPMYFCNLAEAMLRAGDNTQALLAAEQALALRPHYVEASINRAAALFALGRFHEALADYDFALTYRQHDSDLVAYRGDCLRELGCWRAARRAYEEALRRDPNLAHAHANLGPLLLLFGQPQPALRHCERAVALDPDRAGSWMNLAHCRVELEQPDAAMDAYAEAFDRDPNSSELCCRISTVWQQAGDHEQAGVWLSRAWEHAPDSARVKTCLAALLLETGNSEQAVMIYQDLRMAFPDDVDIAMGYGRALWEEGDVCGALANYRHAAALRPQLAAIRCNIAEVLMSIGDTRGAETEQRAALEINPRCVSALAGLATALRGKLPRADACRAADLLKQDWLRDGARSALHAGLAHHYDGSGDHAAAARHAAEGNRSHWQHQSRRGWRYDPGEHAAHVDQIIATFTPQLLARFVVAGNADVRPVFIVGMPRSGTTLTEQILACHPQILGIGERPYAARSLQNLAAMLSMTDAPFAALGKMTLLELQRVASGYSITLDRQVEKCKRRPSSVQRVVDKMPDNYELLGWIALLLPNARLIHVRRDPRDIALSCWMQRFGQIRWACDMCHIAERLVQHQRLMTHWRRILPVSLFEFDYESLVDDVEATSRSLVDFLDLPWSDTCLDYVNREGTVRTASVVQVRQPIYRSSIARWRHYEDLLAPVLKHFPDAVAGQALQNN